MAMPPTRRIKRRPKAAAPKASAADYFRARFGWTPSTAIFHTTAKRECGGCRQVLPGDLFDRPVTPGRPDLNTCRSCK